MVRPRIADTTFQSVSPPQSVCPSRSIPALTWDGQASEGDVDVVFPGREGDVLHATASVFVVLTRHLGLGGTLDGQAETPGTGPPVERRQGGGEVMNGESERFYYRLKSGREG